ncbi:hypothetical protein B0H19DRAFT_1300195 [Mycena capillaripes]|nr:hypothetical protein B0H19DRAFT_1300195 [Mycena capillaripes]
MPKWADRRDFRGREIPRELPEAAKCPRHGLDERRYSKRKGEAVIPCDDQEGGNHQRVITREIDLHFSFIQRLNRVFGEGAARSSQVVIAAPLLKRVAAPTRIKASHCRRMAISSLSASVLPFVEAMPWTFCGLFQFPLRFSLRRGRNKLVTKEQGASGQESDLLDSAESTEQNLHQDTYIPEASYTENDVLNLALSTLSSISSNIPFGSVLSSVIDPLLDIVDRIEPLPANLQVLVEFAARIELLSPLISEMARDRPQQGRVIIEALQRELQTMAKELDDAYSQGRLEELLNGTEYSLLRSTRFSGVFNVLRPNLKGSQRLQKTAAQSSSAHSHASPCNCELNIRAGYMGGKGGEGGHTGGEGGLGEAAQLAMENVDRFRRIHGGTGGQGGSGNVVGGRGGTGEGPKFNYRLLSIDGKGLPPLSVAEFCHEYKLSDKIHKLLDGQRFETVGALFKLTDTDLKGAGFKIGHIAELRRALNDFASKDGNAK